MDLIDQIDQQLWFQGRRHLAPGDDAIQTRTLGRASDVHQAFVDQWKQRWDKHAHLAPQHWDHILGFIDLAIPQTTIQLPTITVEAWTKGISRKKKTAARGPDGVSRSDALLMPPSYQQEIVHMIHRIENAHVWPQQLLDGAIHSLAKVEGAQRTNKFRPITILPLLYRNWATFRAKAMLKALQRIMPPGLRGNMPGQCSLQIWYDLQGQLEACHYQQVPLTGAVGDLIKAFNQLPRKPVFHVARRVGFPESLIRTWEAATEGISRRFYVEGQPSEAVLSHTGFAEGCQLSVVAMALTNLIRHRWMEERCPAITMTTYVDNIELQGPDAMSVAEAVHQLDQFVQQLDMELDAKKTYYWSTNAADRQQLRAWEQPVWEQGRDLGGHLQYIGRQTNSTVTSKCQSLQPMWGKLKRSRAPLPHKRKIPVTKAWPSALHSIPIVHMHRGRFTHLRSEACDAIYSFKSGANSQLQLALIDDPRSDPEYFASWQSVLQFRRQAKADIVAPLMREIAETPPRQRKPGPLGVLMSRLQVMQWQHFHDTRFLDEDGICIDLMHSPIQEVAYRLRRAWSRHVGSSHAARKDFQGLENVDPILSRIDPGWDEVSFGMLRALQNGTFCTNGQLFQAKAAESHLCKFCGAPDSLEHRNMECPATEQSRSQHPKGTLDTIRQHPVCVQRGWFPEIPSILPYRIALMNIPNTVGSFEAVPDEFFTNGAIDFFRWEWPSSNHSGGQARGLECG